MRDLGLLLSILGAGLVVGGRFNAWAYGKSLGNWPLRMFLGMSKLGLVMFPFGLAFLALSLVV
jgi:hypothetical protein